jgi:uncharacterized protein involved in exopolysaccharide biosynthesis
MEVIAVLQVLRRHLYLIAAVCVIATLAGYGISFFTPLIPEKFDASAIVLVRPHSPIKIDTANSGKEVLGFPVAQTPVVESAAKTYIQIIQSPALIAEVVRKLKLDEEAPKKPVGDSFFAQLYASIKDFYDDIQPYLKDAYAFLKYGRVLQEDAFTKAVKNVEKGLVLKSYEDTHVFEIKYSDSDPQRAADVANTLAATFLSFLEEMRSAEAKGAAERLRGELDQSWKRLTAARESLQDYKSSHGVFLYQSEYDSKLKVIADLTLELAKLDQSLATRTLDAGTYEKKRERVLKILEEKRAELAPLPTIERELQLRQSNVDVANATYETVAKELKDAEIKSDAMPEARLISAAAVPQLPSKPRRDIFVLVSVLTGLLVGVGLAFFVEYINPAVRGVDDIENLIGLKVIGTIPLVRRGLSLSALRPPPLAGRAPDASR